MTSLHLNKNFCLHSTVLTQLRFKNFMFQSSSFSGCVTSALDKRATPIKSCKKENSLRRIKKIRRNLVFATMKYSSTILILASAISMVSCTSSQQEVVPKEEPYWKFKNCILARFNMSITIQPVVKNPSKTAIVSIPSDAKVDTDKSSCGDINATDPTKTDQLLVLTWKDGENGYDREISINFRRNLTSHL